MRIDFPVPAQIPQLRSLWKEAFHDGDAFLDSFFSKGFGLSRCRCITEEDRVVSAMYWFDMDCRGKRMAYLYALATAGEFRGRGFSRMLMEDLHSHLALRGYRGAVLVPADNGLRHMYEKYGYANCGGAREFVCAMDQNPCPIHRIDGEEYIRLRSQYTPQDTPQPRKEYIDFLADNWSLYQGVTFIMAAVAGEDMLHIGEFLGDAAMVPQALTALGVPYGSVRVPDPNTPFAMFRPLAPEVPAPGYFGLALD